MSRWFASIAAFYFLTGTGCAVKTLYWADFQDPCTVGVRSPDLTQSAKSAVEVDVSRLDRPFPAEEQDETVQLLTAEECRSFAVQNAFQAQLLELEKCLVSGDDPCAVETQATLYTFKADHERNKAAGDALALFYHLAEADAAVGSLHEADRQLATLQGQLQVLRSRGIHIPGDMSRFERQRGEVQGQLAQATALRHDLDAKLKLLIGLRPESMLAAAANELLSPRDEDLPLETAVAAGLAERADLQGLRMLASSLDESLLPDARRALNQQDAAIGAPALPVPRILQRIFGGDSSQRVAQELAVRRRQLELTLEMQERTAAAEIRSAHSLRAGALQEVQWGRASVDSWRSRIRELRELREADGVTLIDIAMAELELLKAQQELVKQVAAWHVAEVRLKQAMGRLAAPPESAAAP